MTFDNSKFGFAEFKQQTTGEWLQGTKFHIYNVGGETALDEGISCASSIGNNKIWQQQAQNKPTSGVPDFGQGFWWIVHDDWKNLPFAKGMPFFADGCRFRLGDLNNQRPDGNGSIEWDESNLILRVDNHEAQ